MVMTTRPSAPIRMKALGVKGASAALWAAGAVPVSKPMSRPPPSAALTLRNCRRERSTVMSGLLLAVRRALDSLADPRIRAAAADVPRHGGVDIAVCRVGLGGEQRR